ncbi:bestrophin-3-like [Penaeus japonicus]|uniref:bestrophin-3-like n=1 Tax=Penaeus japonicus TaxID=27405 RepID=UPI001C711F09|nr:bestrophin-3-like [Penaeus japonicus]XP_042881646.1 bestrophin-3-like [Penaeus japonicus]XP_042881652.1 bestrophin-3-like [Penaeus japonicus]
MTVIYTDKLASRGGFGSFWKLLSRWRGSVYKMVWQDMLAYIILYYAISFIYRFALPEDYKRDFESFVIHCARFRNLIPVSFVLGFFVSLVVNRWWGTYQCLPWPDTLSILVSTHLKGEDSAAKEIRGTILRYVNLTIALTFAMVSPVVKKMYPSPQHFVNAGYMTVSEMEILDELEKKTTQHKTWVPIMWACRLVDKARDEGRLKNPLAQKMITDELLRVRGSCGGLLGYNTYTIPLVYTQVVTIAVYSFFLFSVIGEQFLDPTKGYFQEASVDLYVPIFAILQLFFYIGWLKVAEALLNPFGADDHDFEFLPLLERHTEISRMLTEPTPNELPALLQGKKEELTTPVEGDEDEESQDFFLVKPDSPVRTLSSSVTYVTCQMNEINMQNDV